MRSLSYIICITVLVSTCSAADWPQWRGPLHNGSTQQTGLPDKLTEETLHWSKPMPGIGAGTPIVVDGRIYHSSTQPDTTNVIALCLDSESGDTLWRKVIQMEARNPRRNNHVSCSPVAYNGGAIFLFGTSHLMRLDAEGQVVWGRKLADDYQPFTLKFGYSSSPLLYKDKLYVVIMRDRGQSMLICVNAADGETVFKLDRNTDAVREGHDSYSTPLTAIIDGTTHIIVSGGDYITAHDPETGAEHWRYCFDARHSPMGRLITTPAIEKNILAAVATRGSKTFAMDLQKAHTEQPSSLWNYEFPGPDVASPVIYKGHVYLVNDRSKSLVCLDLATGAEKWTGQLDRSDAYYASPTAADDKLYLVNRKGNVSVVAADPQAFRLLSTATYDEASVDSTIVAADDKLFLRTAKNLYCFKEKESTAP